MICVVCVICDLAMVLVVVVVAAVFDHSFFHQHSRMNENLYWSRMKSAQE